MKKSAENGSFRFWKTEKRTFDGVFPGGMSSEIHLKYKMYPKHLWFLGFFFLTGSSVFLYQLEKRFENEEKNISYYLFAALIYVLGVCCILISKVEVLKLNKELGTLTFSNRNPWHCIAKTGKPPIVQHLSDILSITKEEYGEFNGDLDTRSHKIRIDFRDGSHCSILESRSGRKTQRRVNKMRAFVEAFIPQQSPKRRSSTKTEDV